MAEGNGLPGGFADIARFAETWALPTEAARNARRRSSSMAELNVFYDAVLPRMRQIISHLNQFELATMPRPEQCLLDLALSFMEVAMSVEVFKEPDESGAFAAHRYHIRPAL